MRRTFVAVLIAGVAVVALSTAALVMAEEEAPQSRDGVAQQGMPGANGAELMDYVLNQNPYSGWGSWTADRWNDYGGYLVGQSPHGATIRIFANDVAQEAVTAEGFDGTLPPGSIILKEGFGGTPDAPGDLAGIVVMYKVDGFNPAANDWFWASFAPDGSAVKAEGAVEGCITCHAQEGHADYMLRYAFGDQPAVVVGEPLPEAHGAAIAEYILTTSPYTEWGSWPTDDMNTDDFSGLLASQAVHGTTIRIFVNDRALNAIGRDTFPGTLPPGSIIVKEGYAGTPDAPGDLTGLSVMVKVDGFNSEANDWFWLKLGADGSVGAEGAVEGCINCHGQDGNSDYMLRYHLPEGMAVEPAPVALDANALIDERCTVCHTRDRIDNKKAGGADRAAWEQTVDRMMGRGAQLSPEEREAVLSFLAGE